MTALEIGENLSEAIAFVASCLTAVALLWLAWRN